MKSVPQAKPASSPAASKPSEDEGNVSVVSVVEELNQNVHPRDLVFVQEKAPVVQNAAAEPVAAAATQSTIVINSKQDNNNAVYTEIKLKHD